VRQIAGALFDALTARGQGQPVYVDAPESNRAAMALAERRGLEPVFHTARMYPGKGPPPGMERVFGVTSLELG
jgi:hypothetical protein